MIPTTRKKVKWMVRILGEKMIHMTARTVAMMLSAFASSPHSSIPRMVDRTNSTSTSNHAPDHLDVLPHTQTTPLIHPILMARRSKQQRVLTTKTTRMQRLFL
jgi:hypothetical protein